MPDYYHAPALLLITLLLPAFGYLFLRFRDVRTLLWFLGFLLAGGQMLLHYRLGWWNPAAESHPWVMAASMSCGLVSSTLFLGSLSPLRFRLGKVQVLYVIPFTLPVLAYAILYAGVFRGISPTGPLFFIFPGLGVVSVVVGLIWGSARGALPLRMGSILFGVFGGFALWMCFRTGLLPPIVVVETGNRVVTVMLLVFVYRRISPGVVLSVMGFTAWSLASLEILPWISLNPSVELNLIHIIVLGKVVAAMGMILLALEDQLAINQAAQGRERRARLELAAYAELILPRRRVEDFDRQGPEICRTVVGHSRFAQAALLLLDSSGRYRLAGAAGLPAATVSALKELARRISAAGFLGPNSAPSAAEHSQALMLDFEPWLQPGDDLERLRFTSALAVPMVGRSGTEGALLLAGNSGAHRKEPLRADDLLPVEVLAARLQSVRSQTMMLEKLIDAEKFAGLGQLAGNVTEQLNNPLTVILGYASLLEEATELDPAERKGVEAILSEARRMRSILESLTRVSGPQGDQLAAVSISELLADLEHLHRSEFLHRSIEFRLNIAPELPKALCQAQQVRQAVLHCIQFAMEAVESPNHGSGQAAAPAQGKTIRLEASAEGNHVQILVAHSGPGFLHPDRAFDPFVPAQAAGDSAGLGLSLCATILRDNNGRASAINFEPNGAAIILELQAA